MKNDINLKDWLANNGGPSILLQIENNNKQKNKFDNRLTSKLLEIEGVQNLLSYLDPFSAKPREKKTLEHLLHYYKDTCIDQFFPRLMDLGFRAGMGIFDKKMEPVRELYSYLLSAYYSWVIMISRYFFMAGYCFEEVINAVKQRINLLYPAAKERIFDIYQDKGKLPKTSKNWENQGIIKDDLNPYLKIKPLPLFYDIAAMAYFPKQYLNPDLEKKFEIIIEYILDPQFQKLPEGYGLLWVKSRRIYHSCGWNPTLPFYQDYPRPGQYNKNRLLYYVNLMSHFKLAQKTQWFIDCLKYLEQYQAEDGTFLFPKELLHQKYVPEAFLNESNLKLKRKERTEMINRIASTLYIYKIYQRINN